MTQHVILATGGVPVLIQSESTGHTYAIGAAVWTEALASDQALVPETIAPTGGAGEAALSAGRQEWHIPWAADGEPVVMRSGTGRAVAIAGAVVQGIGSFAQIMEAGTVPSAVSLSVPSLSDAADRTWLIPVAGIEGGVMQGRGGYQWAMPGMLMTFTEPFDQAMAPATIAATGGAGTAVLSYGRVSWALATTGGAPSNPIYVLA
jgi:hypothetical protein